jgi:hypothetical protein
VEEEELVDVEEGPVVNAGNVIYHHQVNHGQLGQGGGVPFPADGEMLEEEGQAFVSN